MIYCIWVCCPMSIWYESVLQNRGGRMAQRGFSQGYIRLPNVGGSCRCSLHPILAVWLVGWNQSPNDRTVQVFKRRNSSARAMKEIFFFNWWLVHYVNWRLFQRGKKIVKDIRWMFNQLGIAHVRWRILLSYYHFAVKLELRIDTLYYSKFSYHKGLLLLILCVKPGLSQ